MEVHIYVLEKVHSSLGSWNDFSDGEYPQYCYPRHHSLQGCVVSPQSIHPGTDTGEKWPEGTHKSTPSRQSLLNQFVPLIVTSSCSNTPYYSSVYTSAPSCAWAGSWTHCEGSWRDLLCFLRCSLARLSLSRCSAPLILSA